MARDSEDKALNSYLPSLDSKAGTLQFEQNFLDQTLVADGFVEIEHIPGKGIGTMARAERRGAVHR